ncbi:MAG: hypothetical protein K2L73_04060 [Muribaculaceae bacterium]|nr:hypothetical protein [Muribaculaceae bacterium]
MKKYILAAAFAIMSATAVMAADDNKEPNDTVLNVDTVYRVVVTESPAGLNVELNGTGADSTYTASYNVPYENNTTIKSHQNFTMPFGLRSASRQLTIGMVRDLHFGFTGAVGAPDAMDTQMGKSFEIGIGELIFFENCFGPSKRNALSVGMGINWRNYRMTGMNRFDMADDGVVVTDYPEDVIARYSRIKVFSLTFPVSYAYNSPIKAIGKSTLGFKVSGILNYNSHASMLTRYDLADGTKVKENYDRIGQRKFSIDIRLAVRIAPAVNLYFSYSPYNVLKSGHGSPQFNTISTGVSIGCL